MPPINPMRDSDWLSSPGEYQDIISNLRASDPRLRSRCDKNLKQGIQWPSTRVKLVGMEGSPDDASFSEPTPYTPTTLQMYLSESQRRANTSNLRRVFILEGLHPDFIAVLGAHFKMHPSMFVDHERVVVFSKEGENDSPVLPGIARTSQHYTMKYFELVSLPKEAQGSFALCCADTGRHVGVTRTMGKFGEVGVARRKCTIWRQMHSSGSGWDCIILTDPPLRAVRVVTSFKAPLASTAVYYNKVVPVTSRPGHHAYRDFMPHSAQMSTLLGPPRTSMLDDLLFYIRNHTPNLTPNTSSSPTPHHPNNSPAKPPEPESTVAIFAKKTIAAHYAELVTFLTAEVSSIQCKMSRKDLRAIGEIDTMFVQAGQWSDDQALERRISEYCTDLEALMLDCGIPRSESPDPAGTSSCFDGTPLPWDNCTADFQVLRLRMDDVRRRAEALNTAIAGMASMSGNQQSLREARSTKALTLVGLVFIPLAYTATLFSMTEPFGPGEERFWVYCAVSVPLILVVLGGYGALDAVQGGWEGISVGGLVGGLRGSG